MVDPQHERLAKREGDGQFARVGSVLEIGCECGRSGCGEVIALPWCVYEQAQREPRRLLLVPGHELPGIRRALSRYDSFVVVAKEEPGGGRDRGDWSQRCTNTSVPSASFTRGA